MHLTDRQSPIHRPVRVHESWEHLNEPYPGAIVLDDLASFPGDVQAARWIVVRFAAVRAIAALLEQGVDARELRVARSAALNHVLALPMLDREVWCLKRALQSLGDEPTRPLIETLLQAGAAAEQRRHVRGAFAIYHLVYQLARANAWHTEAAMAARGNERLARADGAVYSPRLWGRRARVMEKKCAVA